MVLLPPPPLWPFFINEAKYASRFSVGMLPLLSMAFGGEEMGVKGVLSLDVAVPALAARVGVLTPAAPPPLLPLLDMMVFVAAVGKGEDAAGVDVVDVDIAGLRS